MVIPCILLLAFLGTYLASFGIQIEELTLDLSLPAWYFSSFTAFFFLSSAVNALVTALIVYRVITVYNDIRRIDTGSSQSGVLGRDPLISILIDAGLMTFVARLTQSIMYNSALTAFPLVSGCVVMLYGISTTVVLERVETGISFDHITTRTIVDPMDSRRPIQPGLAQVG